MARSSGLAKRNLHSAAYLSEETSLELWEAIAQIRTIRKIAKRISVASTPSPTAVGVNLNSIDGFWRVETIKAVDLTMLLSRKDPKFRRGPLQNWITFIPGTLTNQSESRTYVG
jgi:hypothetical protein